MDWEVTVTVIRNADTREEVVSELMEFVQGGEYDVLSYSIRSVEDSERGTLADVVLMK